MPHQDDHLANILTGVFFGALIGSGIGLGACIFIFEETLFFTGDTILIGAVLFGVLGFFFGDGFIDWLKENWWWFW